MSFESFMALENKDAVIASLKQDFADVQVGVQETMAMNGVLIQKTLQDSLAPAPAGSHSAPGAAPYSHEAHTVKSRSKTSGKTLSYEIGGELKKSIHYKVLPLMLGEAITLKIYSTSLAFYGHMLEFGTSKMAARPWFFSGIQQMFPSLKSSIAARVNEVIERKNELARKRTVSSAKGSLLRELRPLIDDKEYFQLYRSTLGEVESFAEDRFS
jgi:hypothetical protein